MRKIAIVGSGQAGLLCAHALLHGGHEVTLYSDRTADQWLNESRPTGTAIRFGTALSYERELGLEHWGRDAPNIEGLDVTLCPNRGKRLLTLSGRFTNFALAVDLRLQCHRWLNEFEAKGGNLQIGSVSASRLDEIARAHELTIVAAGRAELCNLFARDPVRSVYDKPQRHLAMVIATGDTAPFRDAGYVAAKVLVFPRYGEIFCVPYYHKHHGPTWNLLLEAKPGGPIDRFNGVESGEKALETAKQILVELAPWTTDWISGLKLADAHGWLAGKFAPTVRKPFALLPSGSAVMPLGDTAVAFDPVGAQGANNGNKMVRHLVAAIAARGGDPFDVSWMEQTFETFFHRYGDVAYTFNNLMLEPATAAMKEVLIAQYEGGARLPRSPGKQAIANDFCDNFDDPSLLTDVFRSHVRARDYIAQKTGQLWVVAGLKGRLAVATGLVRKRA